MLIPIFGWLNINQFLISRRGAGGDYRNGLRPSVFPSGTFRVRYVSPIPLKYFLSIWLKCSPGRGDVQNPCRNCAASRSMSHLKVKGSNTSSMLNISCRLSLLYPLKDFLYNAQMFNRSVWCVEPMLRLRCFKVTLEGQRLEHKFLA